MSGFPSDEPLPLDSPPDEPLPFEVLPAQALPFQPGELAEWDAVRVALGVPGEVVSVEQVSRAWSNRVTRMRTTEGEFAVKELLNPWGDLHWREWLQESVRLERAAIAAGVSAPDIVLNPDGRVLTGVGRHTFRVHSWVPEARACPDAPVTVGVAAAVGADLARVHALDLQPTRRDVFPVTTASTGRQWATLVAALRQVAPLWAERANSVTSEVDQIVAWFEQWRSSAGSQSGTVMSHGDVDPKNLVIDRWGAPWLVDWDVAAPWRPADELIRTAVSMAGWNRPDLARVVVDAYRESGGRVPDWSPLTMTLDLVIGLDWIARCLRRASGLEECDPLRRTESAAMAEEALVAMPRTVETVAHLEDWITGPDTTASTCAE